MKFYFVHLAGKHENILEFARKQRSKKYDQLQVFFLLLIKELLFAIGFVPFILYFNLIVNIFVFFKIFCAFNGIS